ncbi:hypothetical protein M2651_04400 [Clostridium sp. SYSU_GA19001]|uniref:hypothetical protein n=1 Tax=Clostridium caldaquaticum TaxID=2940653 RepID=UPI0020771571|nr:hypothetical protein [Clostridium caldaquaticum]MCM8710266.1 hypothetical protein [Clostridium caldaquaticum]
MPPPVDGYNDNTPDMPKSPPPNLIPDKDKAHALGFEKTPGINLVLPATVMPCLYSFTYIWLNNKASFWAKPVAIKQTAIICWIWNGVKWYSSELQLRDIDSFICKWF